MQHKAVFVFVLGTSFVLVGARNANAQTSLTWIPNSTVKVEQIIGDKDWADAAKGITTPTASQTVTRYDVEGNDIGSSFEHNGKLIVLFGDTIGTKVNYHAYDPMAWSTSTDAEAGLLINFFTNSDGSLLFVAPPGISMGPDDVPNSGISLPGGIYLICNTGADTSLSNPHAHDSSVLARFDDVTNTFYTGRTISTIPEGHFIITSPHQSGTDVVMFGLGDYRATDVYLSVTPASSFESGAGTRYFAGFNNGQPTWTNQEANAVPVVVDNPLNGPGWPNDNPTIGNVSVIYSQDLGLWLMTYDGGRQSLATNGIYFSYATSPWGPWSAPQLIFNAARDHGFGVFIYNPNNQPPGPAGPTIGNNDPTTTRGGNYAPGLIERFTKVEGNTLKIYYTLSTWNPYTIVRMRSEFTIARGPQRHRAARH